MRDGQGTVERALAARSARFRPDRKPMSAGSDLDLLRLDHFRLGQAQGEHAVFAVCRHVAANCLAEGELPRKRAVIAFADHVLALDVLAAGWAGDGDRALKHRDIDVVRVQTRHIDADHELLRRLDDVGQEQPRAPLARGRLADHAVIHQLGHRVPQAGAALLAVVVHGHGWSSLSFVMASILPPSAPQSRVDLVSAASYQYKNWIRGPGAF